MTREGFRFVHATCLCLDEPLSGTGPLSGEDRRLAEEATFLSWQGILETCLTVQADFLLLTGNSFRDASESLRARVALEDGFEKLAAHQIPVYIVPGPLDPIESWRQDFHLPPNVTLLADEHQEPLAVIRHQRVVASVFVIATDQTDEARWRNSEPSTFQTHRAPFRIGVLPAGTPIRWHDGHPLPVERPGASNAAVSLLKSAIDQRVEYVALGEGIPRTERFPHGLAHDPGCAQSLTKQVTGSRGCSVIDVSASGEVRIDRVAVAPVRWEEIELDLDQHCSTNDLVERMALAVMERVADNDERLWIVHWRLSGEGPMYDALASHSTRTELWQRIESELAGEDAVRRIHRLERITRRRAESTPTESATGLLAEFQGILEDSQEPLLAAVRRDLLATALLNEPHSRWIRELLENSSPRTIVRRATAMAGQWLE